MRITRTRHDAEQTAKLQAIRRLSQHDAGGGWQSDESGDVPSTATDAQPGSLAKLAILRRRASQGFNLHHPDDFVIAHTAQADGLIGIDTTRLPAVGRSAVYRDID